MTQTTAYLVRVTTDVRTHQLWVAAASSDEGALTLVLNRIPEGWTAAVLSNKLKPIEVMALNLKPGQAREVSNLTSIAGSSPTVRPTKY